MILAFVYYSPVCYSHVLRSFRRAARMTTMTELLAAAPAGPLMEVPTVKRKVRALVRPLLPFTCAIFTMTLLRSDHSKYSNSKRKRAPPETAVSRRVSIVDFGAADTLTRRPSR